MTEDGLPEDWWEFRHCAEYLGIRESTWRAYVARGQSPAPNRRFGRTPVWKPATIKAWGMMSFQEKRDYLRRQREQGAAAAEA